MNKDGRDERQEFVFGSKHFERLKCSISVEKICCHSAKGISSVSNAAMMRMVEMKGRNLHGAQSWRAL